MTIESRALRKAVELAGSRESLAERVDVKVEELEKWLAGTRPPREVFLRIVDLILDEVPAPADSSDPPAPSQSSAPTVS